MNIANLISTVLLWYSVSLTTCISNANIPLSQTEVFVDAAGTVRGLGDRENVDRSRAAVLTDKTFSAATESFKYTFVAFTAPWCANSRRLVAEMDKVAASISDVSHEVLVTTVDATKSPLLAKEFNVDGYPQVFWKVFSRHSHYKGGQNSAAMLRFIKSEVQPMTSEIVPMYNMTTYDTILRHIRTNQLFVVAFLEPTNKKNKGRDLNAFQQAVGSVRNIPSGYVFVNGANRDNVHIAREFGARVPGVTLFQRHTDSVNYTSTNFRGRITASGISAFLTQQATPPVLTFSSQTAKAIFEGVKKEHVLFIGNFESPELRLLPAAVAAYHRERLNYVLVPASSRRLLLHFDINDSELPLVAIVDGRRDKVLHRFRESLNTADVIKFVDEYTLD